MKTAIRIALVLLALIALGLAALAFALPAIVDGAGLRAKFDEIARDTIGRRLDFGEVSIGILPPWRIMSWKSLSVISPDPTNC